MEGKRVLNSPPEKRKASAGSNGRSRSKRGRRGLRIFTTILKVLGTLAVMGCLTVGMFLWIFMQYVQNTLAPELKVDMGAFTMQQTSVVYYQDRSTGEWKELQRLMGTENRELITYEQIPEDLINAFIAIEDKRFLTHNGVDWKRTAAGLLYMLTGRRIQGGSTITQQLIKNVTDYDDVTVNRKIWEIFTALDLENNYDKKDILTLYMNQIWMGNGCRGVQEHSTARRGMWAALPGPGEGGGKLPRKKSAAGISWRAASWL